MSLTRFTYSTCQPVRKAKNREFSIFHSGVIVQFSWLVGNVFRVVCQDIVDRGVIDCHVRDDSTKYLTEFFLGINTCWQTSNLSKRKINKSEEWSFVLFCFLFCFCFFCDDHSSLSSTTAVQIWIISYILQKNKCKASLNRGFDPEGRHQLNVYTFELITFDEAWTFFRVHRTHESCVFNCDSRS